MAPTPRIRTKTLKEDRAALAAIAEIAGYAPANQAHHVEALQELEADLAEAELEEFRAQRALAAARGRAIEAARRFHDAILSARMQVVAQYGPNSSALKAIGLKRRSDYKRPVRRRAGSSD
jgi:hypothetical protein